MTVLLKGTNINKSYNDNVVLEGVEFEINYGEHIGLVGENGTGKTTLAEIIASAIQHDSGALQWSKEEVKIGYLKQSTYYTKKHIEEMFKASKNFVGSLKEHISRLGLPQIEEIKDERVGGLSGGERTKLALANILASNPTLLILDEPTNHLDYESIEWVIKIIKKFRGTVLIISHDRFFLDKTVKRIFEIEGKKLIAYRGNYTDFRHEKDFRFHSSMNAYVNQEKYKAAIQEDISALKGWSGKAHNTSTKKQQEGMGKKEFFRKKAKKKDKAIKSRIKRLEKIELEGVIKPTKRREVFFEIDSAENRGKRILEIREISKGFGQYPLFANSSAIVMRGERIALFGPNGCGKSTLIKAILGEEKLDSGELYLSPSADIAYLSQDVLGEMKAIPMIEYFNIGSKDEDREIKNMLCTMGFENDMFTRIITDLSLGERTRLKIAKIIAEKKNLLILDEPTNHLDLLSRERLEETLRLFNGTVIIASHDRYLLDKTCNKVLYFHQGRILKFEDSFAEFMKKSEADLVRKSHVEKNKNHKDNAMELMLIEHKLSIILTELNQHPAESKVYERLDGEYLELVNRKKELNQQQTV